MTQKIFSAYCQFTNVPHSKAEKSGTVSKLSLAGYVSAEERIRAMVAAGQRVYNARSEAYDMPADKIVDVDDAVIDPTRSKDYGFQEARVDFDKVTEGLNKTRAERMKILADQRKKDAELLRRAKEAEKAEKVEKDAK